MEVRYTFGVHLHTSSSLGEFGVGAHLVLELTLVVALVVALVLAFMSATGVYF